MSRALTYSNKAKPQQSNAAGNQVKQGEQSQQPEAELSAGGSDHFLSPYAGLDLTQVPARPGLRTRPQVQCCAKDGGNCSCPKCSESREDKEEVQAPAAEAAAPMSEVLMPVPETSASMPGPSTSTAVASGTSPESMVSSPEEAVSSLEEAVSSPAAAVSTSVEPAASSAEAAPATAGPVSSSTEAASATAAPAPEGTSAGSKPLTPGAATATSEPTQTKSESSQTKEVPASTKQEEKSKAAALATSSKPGLIVEDSAGDMQQGQMKKTQFLQLLRQEIRNAIEPVLAKAGQTTEGCPYLNFWLNHYQGENAARVESAVRKYAPDSVNAKSAEEYISVVVQRALRAAEIWASTGELSGVPEGVPLTLPGGVPSPQGDEAPVKRNKNRRSRTLNLIARKGALQAKAKNGGLRNADDPQAIQEDLGSGEPLAGDVRQRMESAFGMNFSHVRTHTDSTANGLSNQMNARAFTVGEHVAFGSGEYRPGTPAGDALIAHELAHTVQQSGSNTSAGAMREGDGSYAALEQDADHTAAGVLGRLWRGGKQELKGMAQRTLPTLRSGLRLQRCGDSKKAPAAPKEKTMPAGTITGTLNGLDMDATATYSDCSACTDGLEAMQVAWATGGPKVGVHETTLPPATETYWSFVDGGSSSPGGAVYSGDHPYYIGRADLPASYGYNGAQGSAGSVSGCTVNVKDTPGAVLGYSDAYFETAFVCLNFNGSGEDKLLEAFKWGFYENGTKHRPGPSAADTTTLEQHGSPSDKFKETLKADYPSYTFT